MAGKDNELLVEFDFIVDLDLALFKYFKEKYYFTPLVDKDFLDILDEREVIYRFLNRKHKNPLELIMPNQNTNNLYKEILDDDLEELLKYATVYETFGLMITFLDNASSVGITIRCRNHIERNFIKSLNSRLNTIVIPKRCDVPLSMYTAVYTKYFEDAMEYINLNGKHLYVAAARFNAESDMDCMNMTYSSFFGLSNHVSIMDLYTDVKFRYKKNNEESEEEANEDLQ